MQQKLRMLFNFTIEQMALLGISQIWQMLVLDPTLHPPISSELVYGCSGQPPTLSILSELLCLRVFSSAKGACLEAPRTEYSSGYPSTDDG